MKEPKIIKVLNKDDYTINIYETNKDSYYHECQVWGCRADGHYIEMAGGEGYRAIVFGRFCKKHIKSIFNVDI